MKCGKGVHLFSGLVWVLSISGCAHPVFKMEPLVAPEEPALWRGRPSAMEHPNYFSAASLRERFCFELVQSDAAHGRSDCRDEQGRPYRVGLALAGGGARAAAYATGVLSGLHAEGILQNEIDVISSVSGGGYAALWYYSRLADLYIGGQRYSLTSRTSESQERAAPETGARAQDSAPQSKDTSPTDSGAENTLKNDESEAVGRAWYARRSQHNRSEATELFADCLPWRYSGLLGIPSGAPADEVVEQPRLCPAGDHRTVLPNGDDPFRFQNHLRHFSDVFSNDFSERPERLQVDIGKLLGLTLLTLPGHWFTNLLFDWNVEVSPSQRQYRAGIERTYGLQPVNLSAGCGGSDVRADDIADCERVRPVPNRLVGRGLTFSTLQLTRRARASRADESGRPRVPFLIVNTTAGVSRTPLDLLEQTLPDFEDSVFEFTPTGYGSRLYGYWPGSHPEVDVVTAVSASAAFFDSQQRSYGGTRRFLIGAGLRIFQLDWGVDIANPWQPDRVRGFHKFLPFPFYYLHRHTKNPSAPYIHLSDGGQSDNTGIFSLVRRGVQEIIFADEAQDSNGEFKDLCVLQRMLRPKSLYLFIPDLSTQGKSFAERCQAKNNPRYAAAEGAERALWQRASAIIKGCITRNPSDFKCELKQNGGYAARLYILKLSVDVNALREQVSSCQESGDPKQSRDANLTDAFFATKGTTECAEGYTQARENSQGLPAEIFGFLSTSRNWRPEKDRYPMFPQHPTWLITLDSSPWLFGAYRELGTWHVGQLLRDLRSEDESGATAESR